MLGHFGTIDGKPTVGAFAFFGSTEYDANVLVVQENGRTVGFVFVDPHSAADWGFDVSGPDGLLRIATDFVDTLRVDRTTSDPAGTFTPMPPTEVAVGSTRGFRYGFAWQDQVGNLERSVRFVAAVPGGFAVVAADAPPDEVGRLAFADDATLVRFLPVLDEIVANLRWPAE